MFRTAVFVLCALSTPVAAETWQPEEAAMRVHVGFLASDEMKGREAGTPEYDIAARYVAAQFETMGLKPAGATDSFIQPPRGVSGAGDGGVLVSAQDVAPWCSALESGRLVPRDAVNRALRAAPLTTGRQAPYNYGFNLDRTRKQLLHQQGGAVPGFSATGLPCRASPCRRSP